MTYYEYSVYTSTEESYCGITPQYDIIQTYNYLKECYGQYPIISIVIKVSTLMKENYS